MEEGNQMTIDRLNEVKESHVGLESRPMYNTCREGNISKNARTKQFGNMLYSKM